jgi:flagellar basal body-associated protein FliL
MSTIICHLCDSVASSDTLLVKFNQVHEAIQPVVKEAETNCNDIFIVLIICIFFVVIAGIAKCAILSWQKNRIQAEKDDREDKKKKEEESSLRKQKSDLKDKLLNAMQKRASEYLVNEKGERIDKDGNVLKTDSKAVEEYIKLLKDLLKELD